MSATKPKAGPMRPVTAVEVSATAAERWREQYRDWSDDDKYADGTTKGEANRRLNSEAHTPENIVSILNKSWAFPTCACCGEYRNVTMEFRPDDWSGESFMLCETCIDRAALVLRQLSAKPGSAT